MNQGITSDGTDIFPEYYHMGYVWYDGPILF